MKGSALFSATQPQVSTGPEVRVLRTQFGDESRGNILSLPA
jgi:hypothetical protein